MKTTYLRSCFLCFSFIFLTSCTPTEKVPASTDISDGTMRQKLIDALLNERLQIGLKKEEGGRNGCEPQSPYYTLDVRRRVSDPYLRDPDAPHGGIPDVRSMWVDTDLGNGITYVEGEERVHVMDVCLE